MKTSITILGSCLSNQIFRVAADEGISEYLIKGATTLVSPFAVSDDVIPNITTILDYLEEDNDMRTLSRRFALDKDYKQLCRGKLLIVDFIAINQPIYEVIKDKKKYFVSMRPITDLSKKNEEVLMEWLKENGYSVHLYEDPLLDFPWDLQKECLNRFANNILELYEQEKILFLKGIFSMQRIRKDGGFEPEGFAKKTYKLNEALIRAQDYFESLIEGCKVISLPDNTCADDDENLHQNGSPTHYPRNTYRYLFKAVDLCTDNLEKSIFDKELEKLYSEWIISNKELIDEHSKLSCNILRDYKSLCSYEYWRRTQQGEGKSFLSDIFIQYGLKQQEIPYETCTSLDEYFKAVLDDKQDFIIFAAVRETANKYWKKWKTRERLGVKLDLTNHKRKSYCVVIDLCKGCTQEYFNDSSNEMMVNYQILLDKKDVTFGGPLSDKVIIPEVYNVMMSSKGRYKEEQFQWAKLYINNIDYSLDKMGLNFVVFSPQAHGVVDSFYVNMWNDDKLTIRRR